MSRTHETHVYSLPFEQLRKYKERRRNKMHTGPSASDVVLVSKGHAIDAPLYFRREGFADPVPVLPLSSTNLDLLPALSGHG